MKAAVLTIVATLLLPLPCSAQAARWTTDTLGPGSLYDIVFVDSLRGWTVGSAGGVHRSTDGGTTWARLAAPTSRDLFAVSFIGPDTGFVVGDSGTFLRTSDGGESWDTSTVVAGFPPAYLHELQFTDGRNGWTAGHDAGRIRKTTDGGATWEETGPEEIYSVDRLEFGDGTDGWALAGSILYHTTDGGTWSSLGLVPFAFDLSVAASGVLYAAGQAPLARSSSVYRSTDGGTAWDYGVGAIDSGTIRDIAFPVAGSGWAIDAHTFEGSSLGWRIHHSVDSGKSWDPELSVDTAHTLRRLFALDDRRAWAVGSVRHGPAAGLVLRHEPPVVGVAPGADRGPRGFRLGRNYPNPFNPSTTIEFELDRSGGVTLALYTVTGVEVARPVDEFLPAGPHRRVVDASALPSGVYFVRLSSGGRSQTLPILLLR